MVRVLVDRVDIDRPRPIGYGRLTTGAPVMFTLEPVVAVALDDALQGGGPVAANIRRDQIIARGTPETPPPA